MTTSVTKGLTTERRWAGKGPNPQQLSRPQNSAKNLVRDFRWEILNSVAAWIQDMEIQEGDTAIDLQEKLVGELREVIALR